MQQSCLVEVAIKVAAGKQCIDVALHAEHHAVRAQPCARRRPHRFKHTEIACALARVSPDLSHNIQTSYTGIQARKLQPKHRNRTGADLVADSDIATACMETSKGVLYLYWTTAVCQTQEWPKSTCCRLGQLTMRIRASRPMSCKVNLHVTGLL